MGTLSQAAALPRKVQFEIDPAAPEPGQEYRVKIYLLNEGSAPIDIKDVVASSIVNGKRSSGALSPRVTTVAPRQRALVAELPDFWSVEIRTWSIDPLVLTARGEGYKNQLAWK